MERLLIELELMTTEEKITHLRNVLQEIDDEVSFAIRRGDNDLALYKMSESIIVSEELSNIEHVALEDESVYL